MVSIGAVVRAHGVRGLVRVRPFDAASDALATSRRVYLGGIARTVEHAARERDEWLVKLGGVDDRDAAEALKGQVVELPRGELPALAPDEVYVADLVGCDVVDPAGAALGRVRSVEWSGAQDLLVVEGPLGEAMVPFVEPLVLSVDLEARRIVCDLPDGLFDLASPPRGEP
jgi:16S rRNA processing protein RimM